MNQSALIIYYLQDRRKEKQFTGLCRRLGIRTRALKASDMDARIGALAGIKITGMALQKNEKEKAYAGYQMAELLIFSGLSDEDLDVFLAEYKKAGIEPVSLKAVVTPHNLGWTVYELAAELVRERTAVLMGQNNR